MPINISVNKTLAATLSIAALMLSACEGDGSSSSDGGSGPTGATGIGGSTARMIIVENDNDIDYLYAIAGDKIQLFDIDTPATPFPRTRITLDWDIQTLFSYKQYLLVGAADGVRIMDNSRPGSPTFVTNFTHARAIDPVVAANDYAYVTLKSDPDGFGSIQDQLNVINIADITNPQLIKEEPMQSPEGLATIDNRLFVCDGRAGLKQFSLDNPADPQLVDVINALDCNDVIAFNGILYVITDTSLQQYDYSMSPPALLSTIQSDNMSADALEHALDSQVM